MEQIRMRGPDFVTDKNNPHLGGNVRGCDPMTYCPDVWDYLIDVFRPQTICDVGCGEGYLLKHFHERGIKVHGTEGLKANKDNAPKEIAGFITLHDYTKGPQPKIFNVDMVLSCEFVEHVEERYLVNYLPQFCAGHVLAFTHALPGQEGYHHVNCQPEQYWTGIMVSHGFTPLKRNYITARKLSGNKLWSTLLIFQKQ